MHPLLVDRLLAYHSSLCSWTSTFLFPTSRGTVDLSPGTGDGAVPLHRYAFQPAKYPSGTTYLFDPNKYLGERSKTSLLLDISSSLGEASLHSVGCEKYTKRVEYSRHRMRCSYGNVSRSVTADNYSPHCFSKNNTIVQSLKRKRHPGELAPERMYTKKMKHDPKKRPIYPNTQNTDIDLFSPARRTLGRNALSHCTRCTVNVYVRNYHDSGHWYLEASSNLVHSNHLRLDINYQDARSMHITDLESSVAKLLYNEGSDLSAVTSVMNQLRRRKGIVKQIKKKTMQNILVANKINLKSIKNISHDWSVAKQTLEHLRAHNISYIALVMDENDNLLVYKGKGRHTREESEEILANGDLKQQLAEVRADLKISGTNYVLLALSIATDLMIRAFHMNPEVIFLDAGANMNRQKRDLLFAVIKEATGHSFVVNATVMPCGRRWIFHKVYRNFFLYLYGRIAISRIQLVLTDDDLSSHGALADVKVLDECWSDVLHMLCVFHGLVMAYHKNVWPLLPHESGNPYQLTEGGKLYCEC